MPHRHPKLLSRAPATRLIATIALALGTISAALVVTELPASASVTTNDYTIGTPGGAVTSVSATPQSVSTSASTAFEVSFMTPVALNGSSDSSVSITPSEALGSTPSGVGLTGASCLQNGTAGAGGAGVATTTQLTIQFISSCSIAAGTTVDVFFNANAPASSSTLYFTVTTSADTSAATSNNVAVGTQSATLSAAHYALGDNTYYTISGVVVGSGGAGNTITLAAQVTSGSEALTFLGATGDYQVVVAPSGGSGAADAVQTASSSGSSVILTLANAVAVGETITITAAGSNPAPSATPQANDVVVTVNAAAAVFTNSIAFGNSVSSASVSPSSNVAGANVYYAVTFKVSTAGSGDIFMSEPGGPTQFGTVTAAEVVDSTQNLTSFTAVTVLPGGTVEIPFGHPTNVGDAITVTLANVTNPPVAIVTDFSVWTTNDPVPVHAAAYVIGPNASPGVVVTVNPSATAALATYTITNVYATAALTAGTSTIGITGPTGTVFPSDAADYSLVDTNSNTVATVTAAVTGGGTNNVTITVPLNVANGDKVTISVADVVNPSTASSTDSIALTGSVTGPAATAPTTTTTTTAPTTTTTRPPTPSVSFITTKAHVVKKMVNLRVFCHGATCKGTIKLTDVRTVVGSKKYEVAAGKSASFTEGINHQGLMLLANTKGKTIKVTEAVSVSGGKTVSKKIALIG